MHNLDFKLKPSRRYIILFSLFFVATFSVFVFLPLHLALKIPGMLLLVGYGGFVFYRQVLLRSRYSIQSIQFTGDSAWRVHTQGAVIIAELAGDSVVTGVISILRFRSPEKFFKATCIILPDSLPENDYRRLRVICNTCQ